METFRVVTIAAMDALLFTSWPGENRLAQLQEPNLVRELNKSFLAFSIQDPNAVIESGFWGCGAFGGDPEIKTLIQLMAASQAGTKQLIFRTFGDDTFAESLNILLSAVKEVQVSTFMEYLEEVRMQLAQRNVSFRTLSDETPFLFETILKKLAISETSLE